jgi:hypothetical protein
MTEVIDNESGEILDVNQELTIESLDEAENLIFTSVKTEKDLKLSQVKALVAIRNQRLYEQRINPMTGLPFTSMKEYLPHLGEKLEAISGWQLRTLLDWLTKYRVFVEELGYSEKWLMEMGSHTGALLPAANVGHHNKEFSEEDKVLDNGTIKLGKDNFKELVEEVYERISESKSQNIPELTWTVEDTRNKVREVTGKPEPVRVVWTVKEAGDKLKVEITWWLGEFKYTAAIRELVAPEHLSLISKGAQIDGYNI